MSQTEVRAMTACAIIDAVVAGRAFWWITSHKQSQLTVMDDWKPRLLH